MKLGFYKNGGLKGAIRFLILFTVALVLGGPLVTAGSAVYASEDTLDITKEEIDQATDNLSTILAEAYSTDPNMSEETVAQNVMLYSFSEAPDTSERTKRSLSSFSQCMVIKMGLGELRDGAKMVFNEQVVRYLKSQAWKKASAMIVQRITRFAGKKIASFAVKRLAHFALPGIGWGSLAIMGAQCGWAEIH